MEKFMYSKSSKISNTFLFLFSTKMLVMKISTRDPLISGEL